MGGEERDFLGCAEVWDGMGTKLGSAKGGGEVGGVDRELMQLLKYLKESDYDSNKYTNFDSTHHFPTMKENAGLHINFSPKARKRKVGKK